MSLYRIMYIHPSQRETPRLHNSPMFSAGTHNNKTLYLATIGHESAHACGLWHYVNNGACSRPIFYLRIIAYISCKLCSIDVRRVPEERTASPLYVYGASLSNAAANEAINLAENIFLAIGGTSKRNKTNINLFIHMRSNFCMHALLLN